MRWQVNERGELLVAPTLEAEAGELRPLFAGADDVLSAIANLGTAGFANLWLTGPRDLASLTDPALHFEIRGLRLDNAALRRRVAGAGDASTPQLARQALLDRILAVRLLQQRGEAGARDELEAVAADADADAFLRLAARDALAALAPDAAAAGPDEATAAEGVPNAVLMALREVPAGADIVLFADQRRVRPPLFLPGLAARVGLEVSYTLLTGEAQEHGAVPVDMVAGAVRFSLAPVLVPYELARRYGNARLDWTLLAARVPTGPEQAGGLWLRADGLFEHERIAAGLAGDGFDARPGQRRETTVRAADGAVLKFGADRLRLVAGAFAARSPATGSVEELLPADVLAAPAWCLLPPKSQLLAQVKALLPGDAVPITSAALRLSFGSGVDVGIVTDQASAEDAERSAAALREARDRLVQDLTAKAERAEGEERPAATLRRLAGVLRAATPRADGRRTTTQLSFAGWKAGDLLALALLLAPTDR